MDPYSLVERQRAWLQQCTQVVQNIRFGQPCGRLVRVTGMVMQATGLKLPLGSVCQLERFEQPAVEAEVVGFSGETVFLVPLSHVYGLQPGTLVMPLTAMPHLVYGKPTVFGEQAAERQVPVGTCLLGRVLDALGRPLDDKGPIHANAWYPLYSQPVNPLNRSPVRDVLDVGVRAINGLLTVGSGQRLGLFSGSGVGKSVLLGMMARFTRADVVVVGLIGERGREVRDFIEHILGEAGLARSVVVAAPADVSPLMRLHGAAYATALAEYFRDQGNHVLLLMDSVTRYAMAQREIALAIGEPPVTKGYPPSVFTRLPQLIERAGNALTGQGSITGFYTVLSEGDDQQDPVADAARAILDGHIVLSRELAEAGHYPAIDIEQSISRVMVDIVPQQQLEQARQFKQLYSRYQRSRDLISVGAYVSGADPILDEAIKRQPSIMRFLAQPMQVLQDYSASCQQLGSVLA